MPEFGFVLMFSLANPADDPQDYTESLGTAGCTDALVGVGQLGIVALDFARQASSARSAVTSAIKDVQSAIPGAKLVEASPDLVGLSEVAEILGFSRQYLRKLAQRSVTSFPTPIHQGRPSIWHLAPVLRWFETTRHTEIDSDLMGLARVNMHLNIAVSETGSDAQEIEYLRALLV